MTETVTSCPPGAGTSSSAVKREFETCLLPADCRTERLPKTARDLVAEHLHRWGLASFVQDARTVASELVTNAVQHAPYGVVGITVKYADGELRIEVEDGSPDDPALGQPDSEEERGRGLQLVQCLSDAWGSQRNARGTKTVWCAFHAPSATRGSD